jgi:hypothetical protein
VSASLSASRASLIAEQLSLALLRHSPSLPHVMPLGHTPDEQLTEHVGSSEG